MIGQLTRRSPAELATRIRQKAAVQLERFGVSSWASLPTEPVIFSWFQAGRREELLERFLSRGSVPFAGMADPVAVDSLVRVLLPERRDDLLAQAERLEHGCFDLLGYKELFFGEPVDWHLDPVSRRRAPLVHWSRINPLDVSLVGDHKVVWELNRHQHLVTLSRAWLATRDDRHAKLVARHLNEWMDANPPKLGVNWTSSLELAYRAIAWLWSLRILAVTRQLPAFTLARALGYLWLHGTHIEAHLSTYFSPNTHLTGEALGLLYIGSLVPDFPDAHRWRRKGWRILMSELDRQVLPDGTYFERATYYHRYTTDIYTHAFLLGRAHGATGEELSRLQAVLTRLMEHLAFLTRPDGTTPLIGDDDGGHLWFPDHMRPTDFRSTLSTGAALLQRADLAFVAGRPAEETLWLLGEDGAEALGRIQPEPPRATSRDFPLGGVYVLRDEWGPEASVMVIDAGPHGVMNCGHAHADALSFDLTVCGRAVIVDPGTFTYSSAAERDAFRSTLAHNTVSVAGRSSSDPGTPFRWNRVVDARCRRRITTPEFDYLDAEHGGYAAIGAPGSHRREILYAKGVWWCIRDGIGVPAGHEVVSSLQLAPGLAAELVADGAVIRTEDGEPLLHLYVWTMEATQPLVLSLSPGWVSDAYGRRRPAQRFLAGTTSGGGDLITLLIPVVRNRPTVAVERCSDSLTLQFELNRSLHTVVTGCQETFRGDDLEIEDRWVWRRAEGVSESSDSSRSGEVD
jgi:hypothetical protein